VYVQWCLKGVTDIDDDDALRAFAGGLLSNWFHDVSAIDVVEIPRRLTAEELDWHVNRYDDLYPPTGRRYGELTPFLSLTAGSVSRDAFVGANIVLPARRTALQFATRNGTQAGYVFRCWVPVALNRAVGVEGVAEEVRELNTYRAYSAYQPEGEITAKVRVPPAQVESCTRYDPRPGNTVVAVWRYDNPGFVAPDPVMNLRTEI
jgi:hypothetical protein